MDQMSKSQLKKEIKSWFIQGVLIYAGVAAFVSLILLSVYTLGGYLNLGPAPVLAFAKAWGLLTVAFIGMLIAFRIFFFLVELLLFILFAIGYVSYKGFKQWRENRKNNSGPGAPPSLRDRWPGEPPHR